MTTREKAIAEKAQEMLAKKISEYVRELYENRTEEDEITQDDEERIDSEVSEIFEYWKDEIEESAKKELQINDEIFHAIWTGFNHMNYCIETAKEAAERIRDEMKF